jgi:CheY-like chemotaxis protein/HPt (histidine-containing phosphotransfer) domain-containing protein
VFHFTAQFGVAAAPAEAPAAVAAGPAPLPSPRRTLRILVAEDTLPNQKLVVHLLTKRGHTAVVAKNGREVLDLLRREDFDLVVMDVQMPGMDGFQATAAIRALADETKARVPIVAMTAHALRGDRERCLAAGMDGYVSKPIGRQELVETVERLAEKGRQPNQAEIGEPAERSPDERPPAEPERSALAAEVFSLEQAMTRCLDRQMFRETVDFFFTDSPGLLKQMRTGLRSGDLEGIVQPVHRLRGTLVYLGAPAALKAAAEVERAAAAADLAATAEAVEPLLAQLKQLETALAPYRQAGE